MKNYRITVNGNAYDVTVEETGSVATAPVATAPVAALKAAPAPKAPVASGNVGAVKINAPMPGKILSVKASVGASVKKGDIILVLEAMKMENEIQAPSDGTIASINVNEGSMVETGELLASLN
jgi:glutaconyl-CoA/methylmalonyl-CoA decarboxylase subunit gamma